MGQQVNVYRKLKLFPGAIVEGSWGANYDRGGRTYYVNDITGSSTNDGLSWNNPMDELDTAFAASETYRALKSGTTNDYIMNTIVIQGTGTNYALADTNINYANVIGLGSMAKSQGAGQVRVGAGTTSGLTSTAMRGVNFNNIVFEYGADTKWGISATHFLRGHVYECQFLQAGTEGEGGMNLTTLAAGLVIERCHFNSNSGGTQALYGLKIDCQFSDCTVIDNTFQVGTSALVYIAAGGHGTGTVFARNFFTPSNTSAVGFYDLETNGYAMLAGNFFSETNAITDRISRVVGYRVSGNTDKDGYIYD